MKNLIKATIFAICSLGATACSVDTHYDSVSTHIDIDVAKLTNDGSEITVYQRFQFDRDLVPLEEMTLEEAWISAPDVISDPMIRVFTLDMVRSLDIKVVPDGTEKQIPWLRFDASNASEWMYKQLETVDEFDLRQYINSYQQLEIQINISLEPYQVTRYWKEICNFSDKCTISLPLSMYFKMAD